MIGYGLLVQLICFDLPVACCAGYNLMLFAFVVAFVFDDTEALSRFEEGAIGAIIPLTIVCLISSVLWLHAFISAGTTRNVLLQMEEIVNLPLCVLVVLL